MSMHFPFDNSYARLPERFYTRMPPEPVADPTLVAVNRPLADALGIVLPADDGALAQLFAGNVLPDGATPLAQVYAGHQFGGWSPQLGDGRAILIGEVVDAEGTRRDIQFKGSGRTPYSRMGDGRAWLGPVMREYLVSEAMYALGIPTTRALAAVLTGERVVREAAGLPGAVLTRVAASHIRVGTFQFFAARGDIEALDALTRHAIARHYPGAEGPRGLLQAVVASQADLIARWMSVGFVHGVMNTDNCAISGETIDYGPCAFMDTYAADRVFSSIDQFGRYAYGNQANVAMWNLAQFATALLPLEPDRDAAIAAYTADVQAFADQFDAAWNASLAAKIGLSGHPDGAKLGKDLLAAMEAGRADFTRTFRALSSETPLAAQDEFTDRAPFSAWYDGWWAQVSGRPDRVAEMQAVNPAVIPRNHRIEAAITAATAGDFGPFERLRTALSTPLTLAPDHAALARAPATDEMVTQTFCGT
ncbi:MAG: YdiU family protein [Pseudomonadota bacterium]